MPTLDKTIGQLNQLLVICHDGQRYCEDFSRMAHDPNLKQFFTGRGLEWASAGEQTQRIIQTYGGRPRLHTSLDGKIHRSWENLKAVLGNNDDYAMLDECLRFEAEARQCYDQALQQQLAPWAHHHLSDQYELLLERQAQVRALLSAWRS